MVRFRVDVVGQVAQQHANRLVQFLLPLRVTLLAPHLYLLTVLGLLLEMCSRLDLFTLEKKRDRRCSPLAQNAGFFRRRG